MPVRKLICTHEPKDYVVLGAGDDSVRDDDDYSIAIIDQAELVRALTELGVIPITEPDAPFDPKPGEWYQGSKSRWLAVLSRLDDHVVEMTRGWRLVSVASAVAMDGPFVREFRTPLKAEGAIDDR